MEIIRLTEDNIWDYEEYLTEDMADNLGRTYYSGLVVTDEDEPVAGMVWELLKSEDETTDENHIEFFQCKDESAAKLLFDEYDSITRSAGVKKSTFTLAAKPGKEEKDILKNAGFSVKLMEGDIITAKLSDVAENEFLKKITPDESVKPLRTATQRGFSLAMRRLTEAGHKGTCQDIAMLPRIFFENDVSCYAEDDGVISGLFLCHRRPSGMVEVMMMAAMGKNQVKKLPAMIKQAIQSGVELYDPDTKIIINRHNYASLALGEKLFPTGFGMPVYVGERTENE